MSKNNVKADGLSTSCRYTMFRMNPDVVRVFSGMLSIKLASASSTVAWYSASADKTLGS
jgi:hypothetical protein